MKNTHPSDSTTQQKAEIIILQQLASQLNADFNPMNKLPIDINVNIDAIDINKKILVEVYAHIGNIKGAQANKIKGDILKLKLVTDLLENGAEWTKVLCFTSHETAKFVLGQSWVAEAVKQYQFDVVIIDLDETQKNDILFAQQRQNMINQNKQIR